MAHGVERGVSAERRQPNVPQLADHVSGVLRQLARQQHVLGLHVPVDYACRPGCAVHVVYWRVQALQGDSHLPHQTQDHAQRQLLPLPLEDEEVITETAAAHQLHADLDDYFCLAGLVLEAEPVEVDDAALGARGEILEDLELVQPVLEEVCLSLAHASDEAEDLACAHSLRRRARGVRCHRARRLCLVHNRKPANSKLSSLLDSAVFNCRLRQTPHA
mmetsp:Transcript_1985/g.3620  ORF Transcript_1985/g.3620 Transcript_1985/m.3620 type:complete len:218 (+) Transcript_1985:469-1122(+)